MKKILSSLIIISAFVSCSNESDEPDAWGNFEANEILISAETSGRILTFPVHEGNGLQAGQEIAKIDTTLLYLQFEELIATGRSITSRLNSIDAQNDILEQQISNLKVNIKRVENMLEDGAATRKEFDDLSGQLAVLEKKILANNSQKVTIRNETAVLETKKAQLIEQINRCKIKSPSKGVIIQKYAEAGELTTIGKPLLKIADMNLMELKVYVSGAQLSGIRLGEECTIRIDKGEKGYNIFTGIISQISDKAEFTPKIIQTHDERVSMVYAVIIRVNNDGSIKSGMPGEAIFNHPNADSDY